MFSDRPKATFLDFMVYHFTDSTVFKASAALIQMGKMTYELHRTQNQVVIKDECQRHPDKFNLFLL